MMKVKMTLELMVDEDDAGVHQMDVPAFLRQLCRDALGEFRAPRRDAWLYVANRYPDSKNREVKVAEVEGRVQIARALSAAISDATIEVEPCCPECGATEPKAHSGCPACEDAYQDMMEGLDAQMGDPTP